ncbi:hypothetical protein EVAR_45400_1 [Eumeta japonica]|uniref:Uncharacterized protein n=1 Tax=Eumeta variegata TaxID=151549 RepID=A0A4C1WTS0_EUMVA|nr:hypothetical protein EVAR_45400_1 [Eumeta japonica]
MEYRVRCDDTAFIGASRIAVVKSLISMLILSGPVTPDQCRRCVTALLGWLGGKGAVTDARLSLGAPARVQATRYFLLARPLLPIAVATASNKGTRAPALAALSIYAELVRGSTTVAFVRAARPRQNNNPTHSAIAVVIMTTS